MPKLLEAMRGGHIPPTEFLLTKEQRQALEIVLNSIFENVTVRVNEAHVKAAELSQEFDDSPYQPVGLVVEREVADIAACFLVFKYRQSESLLIASPHQHVDSNKVAGPNIRLLPFERIADDYLVYWLNNQSTDESVMYVNTNDVARDPNSLDKVMSPNKAASQRDVIFLTRNDEGQLKKIEASDIRSDCLSDDRSIAWEIIYGLIQVYPELSHLVPEGIVSSVLRSNPDLCEQLSVYDILDLQSNFPD